MGVPRALLLAALVCQNACAADAADNNDDDHAGDAGAINSNRSYRNPV